MAERIQLVSRANFLYNMVKMFANTSNTLTQSRRRTPLGARHESTALCGWGVFHQKTKERKKERKKEKEMKQCLLVKKPRMTIFHP